MKKLIPFCCAFIFASSALSQTLPASNYTICPGRTATLVGANSGNLSNPGYSLNPGAITSANPTFVISPGSTTSYTIYTTGINSQNVLVTNTAVYNFSVTPASTMAISILQAPCGGTNAVVSATILNWSTAQPTLVWSPAPLSLNNNSTIAIYIIPSGTSAISASLTSLDPLGCGTTSIALVNPAPPIPSFAINNITGSQSITCSYPSINLAAVSNYSYNGGTLNYFWASNSATFSTSNVNVTSPGSYTITVNDAATNCYTTQVITIGINTVQPSSIITPTSQTISCSFTSVTSVSATANPSQNITHQFIAPPGGLFSAYSYTAIYTPSGPGTYTHYLINNINGCSTYKTFTVAATQGFPTFQLQSSPPNFSLGCTTKSVTTIQIMGGMGTSGPGQIPTGAPVSYTIIGPPTSSNIVGPPGNLNINPTFTVTVPGTWTVIVRDNNTFCETRVPVSIIQNVFPPNIAAIVPRQVLDCNVSQVKLEGISSSASVGYKWLFPPNGTAAVYSLMVNANLSAPNSSVVGNFTLVVTDSSSTCKSTSLIPIYQNLYPPKAIIVSILNALTCATPSVILMNQSTPGTPSSTGFPMMLPVIGSLWTGPNPQVPLANSSTYLGYVPGMYNMTAKDLNNGCVTTTVTYIGDNRTPPIVTVPVFLYDLCGNSTVTLSPVITGSTSGLSFLWAIPVNATVSPGINTANLVTNAPGIYTLTVTDPNTSCAANAQFAVGICVGIGSVELPNAITVFPNPGNGLFTLRSERSLNNARVEIYSASGILVKKEIMLSDKTTINLQNEANGIYIIRVVENGKTISTSKIINN